MAANDTVDPFVAPSQLYLWSTAEEKVNWLKEYTTRYILERRCMYIYNSIFQFTLVQEFMGQHVTSGIFLNSKKNLKERFFTLTQYKAAKSQMQGTKLNTKVQVRVGFLE